MERLIIVELDPMMTEAAKKFFEFRPDSRVEILHEDARAFLNRQDEKFGLVFVDVFNNADSVPFQMATIEAARRLRAACADDGVVIMNVISTLKPGSPARMIRATMASAFREAWAPQVDDRSADEMQNVIIMAFAGIPRENFPKNEETRKMLAKRLEWGGDQILSDEFAPVEREFVAATQRSSL